MKLVDKIKELTGKQENGTEKSKNYLTGKEIRAIAKENSKIMFRLFRLAVLVFFKSEHYL